jgi:hypothetical protein
MLKSLMTREFERLVVHDGGARIERQDVFSRGLRIHRHQEVDFLLPGDVTAPARPDGVPRGQSGDVRRKHVLAGDRNTGEENGPQQDEVGRLAPGAVDGGHLDAEVVDDALLVG